MLFANTIKEPSSEMEKVYARQHVDVPKDVERPFGVLVAHLNILKNPRWLLYRSQVAIKTEASIIIHNVVVKSRRSPYESGMNALCLAAETQAFLECQTPFKWVSSSLQAKCSGEILSVEKWAATLCERETLVGSTAEHSCCALPV